MCVFLAAEVKSNIVKTNNRYYNDIVITAFIPHLSMLSLIFSCYKVFDVGTILFCLHNLISNSLISGEPLIQTFVFFGFFYYTSVHQSTHFRAL